MSVIRYAAIITTLLLGMGVYGSSIAFAAGNVVIRRAATPPAPTVLSGRAGETRPAGKARRLSLSPIPYKPDRGRAAPVPTFANPGGLADIRGLVKKVNQCVVAIRMLDSGSSWSLGDFGVGKERSQGKAMGYGAGFVVSAKGYILTNEHVLRNGSKIEVELLDGRKYFAKVIRKDAKNDLALLKIPAERGLFPVTMGNSDAVELGEWVVGIGNPYGIGQSLMIGIVSAKRRKIPGSGYPPLIQIDAAMNLGNSGGPLFNLKGEVVGINTILLWKSQGIGFATPINVAKHFLDRRRRSLARTLPSGAFGPLGPVSDAPRTLHEAFNPLAPPWKYAR
jgi:serine protease Do